MKEPPRNGAPEADQKFPVWVLPNGRALGLVAVLAAMCYAGASQGNGAAYLLCFVLSSLAIVSAVHAWANMRGLAVAVESIPPVFAGDEVFVPVAVKSQNGRPHFAIQLSIGREPEPTSGESITPLAATSIEARFTAPQRGRYHELPLKISSDYPFGFFTGRQRITLAQDYYVYPTPRGDAPPPRVVAPTRQPREGTQHEGDDFGGVRMWRPGESQRHIDWKAAARNDVLLTKQWTGEDDDILCLDWAALPALDVEARLSQMAKWVVAAEHGYATYELHLPGKSLRAARGDKHYHECLRALAAFEAPGAAPSA